MCREREGGERWSLCVEREGERWSLCVEREGERACVCSPCSPRSPACRQLQFACINYYFIVEIK